MSSDVWEQADESVWKKGGITVTFRVSTHIFIMNVSISNRTESCVRSRLLWLFTKDVFLRLVRLGSDHSITFEMSQFAYFRQMC